MEICCFSIAALHQKELLFVGDCSLIKKYACYPIKCHGGDGKQEGTTNLTCTQWLDQLAILKVTLTVGETGKCHQTGDGPKRPWFDLCGGEQSHPPRYPPKRRDPQDDPEQQG